MYGKCYEIQALLIIYTVGVCHVLKVIEMDRKSLSSGFDIANVEQRD